MKDIWLDQIKIINSKLHKQYMNLIGFRFKFANKMCFICMQEKLGCRGWTEMIYKGFAVLLNQTNSEINLCNCPFHRYDNSDCLGTIISQADHILNVQIAR